MMVNPDEIKIESAWHAISGSFILWPTKRGKSTLPVLRNEPITECLLLLVIEQVGFVASMVEYTGVVELPTDSARISSLKPKLGN